MNSTHSAKPQSDLDTSSRPLRNTLVLLICAVLATGWIYDDVLQWFVRMWRSSEDYSHGFLVPLVSIYVLYSRRETLATTLRGGKDKHGILIGVAVLVFGLIVRLSGIYTSIRTLEGLSLIIFLFGVVILAAGWGVGKWAAPAIAYLVFMVPLPGFLGGQLSGALQSIATSVSTFSLQTVGVPAVGEGNIIHLSNGTIGVAQACSGLRMLYAFFALTVAACLVLDRRWIEKLILVACAVPIAVAVNCIRIVATGMAYEYASQEVADRIFHDLAGWFMMPMGIVLLFAVLAFLRGLITWDDEFEPRFAP